MISNIKERISRRAELCLVTGFAYRKVVFPKYLDDGILPFVRRLHLGELVPDKAAKGKAVQPSDKGEKFSVMIRDLGELIQKDAKWKFLSFDDSLGTIFLEDLNPTTKLQPTDAEMGQNWYRKSYDCLDGKEKSIQLDEFGIVSNHDNESDSILDKMDVVPRME
nr:hypothetical protein [Tanacetum cinerariifolium]